MKKSSRLKSWMVLAILLFGIASIWYLILRDPVGESHFSLSQFKVNPSYVLVHDLDGPIMESKKWIERVDKYAKRSSIRAIVLNINSPGGAVGPSQELYSYLKQIREDYKKPVVVYSGGVLASGAYYTALGANEIITAPGAIVGSIGVIMGFLNLEGLYDWAKIKRFSVTTGKYKDSGAEYRPMRDDEKDLFQDMINDVYLQFTNAVKDERNLSQEKIDTYCDGRVMTGQQAQDLGFTDKIGTLETAINLAIKLSGAETLERYSIPKEKRSIFDLLVGDEDAQVMRSLASKLDRALNLEWSGRPLYLMPGALGH